MKDIASLIIVILWVAGLVIAEGFRQVLLSILLPPYAIYLVVEKVMISQGWI